MNMSILQQDPNGIYIPLQNQPFQSIQQNQINIQPMSNPPQSNQIIMNQMIKPQTMYVDITNIKTDPCQIVCPYCKNQIKTRVVKDCNWYSVCLCYCYGFLTWTIFQCCRNKAYSCFDAEHFCPRCGNKIAEYSSC